MSSVALCVDQSRRAAEACANDHLFTLSAVARVAWALENLTPGHAVSSSFGAQSAVTLHLMTRVQPEIPVILVDTGYLFPETYQFVDELSERLSLNLNVYRPRMSPAWQEALHGKRWEQGLEGIEAYNRDNKVEPMERGLKELGAKTWFAGLRRGQSASRSERQIVESAGERWKVHPIVDWTDGDVYQYLKRNKLPYHPLWDQGYVSIGDWHTTRSLLEVDSEDETRFFGLKRECGLHDPDPMASF